MQNQSKKRHNSQPLEGTSKDARSEQREVSNDPQADDTQTWSQVAGRGRGRGGLQTFNRFGLLSQANSYPDRTMRSASISSRAGSTRSTRGRGTFQPRTQQTQSQIDRPDRPDRPSDLGENTRFVTPAQNGPFRDEIVVECQTLNDRPFKGTITFREATEIMFTEIMGFQFADLYSVRMRFSGCPTVRFKLKEQVNIDDLRSVEHFNLERKAQNSRDIDFIACKILGIRGMVSVPHYDGSENDVRWVKIEGTEYQLTEEQIRGGLEPFGELLTPIREDIHDDSDSERDVLVGNGTYSVKMKLTKPIPQFLPMCSRRIRIYHNGITKLCTNCYGRHTRRQCRNEKRQWIEYVRDFMFENDNLNEAYYGKWWEIIDNEFPGYFDQNDGQPDQHHQEASNPQPERLQKSVSRFADSRKENPRPSRDPRVNRSNNHEQQRTSNTATSFSQIEPDRQQEMTSLLASGLTLTDAKKYLANKKEQEEIERRMINAQSQRHNPQPGQGRGRGTH